MELTDEQYEEILKNNNIVALHPRQVAEDYGKCNKEWYHCLMHESDFNTFATRTNLVWYSVCRCHLVDTDGNSSHEHMHGLVHFVGQPTLGAFKKRLLRKQDRLHPKTTFKRIICLDHAVGVLRYLCCNKGRHSYKGKPHFHYNCRPFDSDWVHERDNKHCSSIRNEISRMVSDGVVDLSNYASAEELHDSNSCKCSRGLWGKRIRVEATKKRREFYKTGLGQQVKDIGAFREKCKMKTLKWLRVMPVKANMESQRDRIANVIDGLF